MSALRQRCDICGVGDTYDDVDDEILEHMIGSSGDK